MKHLLKDEQIETIIEMVDCIAEAKINEEHHSRLAIELKGQDEAEDYHAKNANYFESLVSKRKSDLIEYITKSTKEIK